MNEATASIVRTFIKSAAVVVIFIGWPKFGKPHVFNQTVIQPSEAEDLTMRNIILELHGNQHSEDFAYFERAPQGEERTDGYYMPRADWVAAGRPDTIGISVTNLKSGVGV